MLNVIFMGTPAFAVPALQALIDSPHRLAAVYSQPPRPAGRGLKETPSPVHLLAEKHHIPVHTPASLKPGEIQQAFTAHQADIAVVAAYGLLLPKPILEACPLGCINIHPSLLPRWRGAAPIQRTLMAGDARTAVCIMQMDAGLDTGDVLMKEEFAIPADWNAGKLHDVCADLGAQLVLKTLTGLEQHTLHPTAQSQDGVTYAKKITKDECRIDWQQSAHLILHQIRGLAPSPGATCLFEGELMKILSAEVETGESGHAPGTIIDASLRIACGKNILHPTLVQRAGKKPMAVADMLRGSPVTAGTMLE